MQYPKGTNILGYLVDYLVSETAMATIYCVEHRALRSKHAIKFLNPQFADVPSIRAVYGREMQTLSDLRSPYLVRITEVINSKWGLGIVMDWLDGETLETYLRKVDGVTGFFAVKWACQILSALQLYHQNDLLHLGICPHNIFLEKVDGGRVAILMDHNIGRRMEQGKRKPTFNLESSYYCSPEQINAPHQLGIASDVYSVGVLLYRMLTGNVPFQGDTEYQIMHSIVSDEIPPFPDHLDIPDGLEEVIRKAMSRDISARYQTAFEFLEALRSLFSQPLLEGAVSEQVVVEMIEKKEGSAEFEMAEEEDEQRQKKEKAVKSFFQRKRQHDATRISSPSNKKPARSKAKNTAKKSTDKRKSVQQEAMPIVIWLPNRWYVLLGVLVGLLLVLLQGGILGRETKILYSESPSWGKTEAFLDGEKQPQDRMRQADADPDRVLREYSRELALGEHQFMIRGGVWRRNTCNRCCWKQEQLFSVPFGFGEHNIALEFTDKEAEPNCPSLEQSFYFADISTGTFLMGSPRELFMRGYDELWHVVQLSHPFYLSKHEVTQALFEEVMGRNPSLHRGEKLPVENVSFLDAIEFCNQLSIAEGLDPCYEIQGSNVYWEAGFACDGYRLPTEAEWEYAAKASSLQYDEITIRRTELATGNSAPTSRVKKEEEYLYFGGKNPGLISWYGENAQRKTHPVGTKYPNAWGLYDMSGNVSEWTWDIYGAYSPEAVDPKGASVGRKRVIRGGNYSSTERAIRVTTRDKGEVDLFTGYIGFRIARSLH